jgi:hypothetical protein
VGREPFDDAFFQLAVQRALLHPFHLAFRRQTPIATLTDWARTSPGLAPAGIVLHASRCGSTLVARALAAVDEHIVHSEPPPLDFLLRTVRRHYPDLDPAHQDLWLRALLSAWGQARRGPERRLFIKADAWHIADLPVIRRVWPDTPLVFLYRDPVEILVSQLREPAQYMIPGLLGLDLLGLPPTQAVAMAPAEYCARMLGALFAHAADHAHDPQLRLVNYAELPDALSGAIARSFGLDEDWSGRPAVREALRRDAKRPGQPFVADSAAKQTEATPEVRELAERWIAPHYRRLEARRLEAALP